MFKRLVIVLVVLSFNLCLRSQNTCFNFEDSLSTWVAPYTWLAMYDLVAADLNDDGNLELITSVIWGDSVVIFWSNPNGIYDNIEYVPLSQKAGPLEVVDFNQDGKEDIIVCGPSGIQFLFQQTTGWEHVVVYDNYSPTQMEVDDFNNDGLLDIAYTQGFNGNLLVSLGMTLTDVEVPVVFSTPFQNSSYLNIGDINDDGHFDIVVTGMEVSGYPNPGGLGIFYGDNEGGFLDFEPIDLSRSYQDVAIADLNEDGNQDIVAVNSFDLYFYINDGQGGFDNLGPFWSFGGNRLVLADINSDGHVDIINYEHGRVIHLGDGLANFELADEGVIPFSSDVNGVSLGDFNKDLKVDIAEVQRFSSTGHSRINWYYNCTKVGVHETMPGLNAEIFPNPVTNTIFFSSFAEFPIEVEVFDALGNLLMKSEISSANPNLDVSRLSSGTYFIQTISNEERMVQKIVIL